MKQKKIIVSTIIIGLIAIIAQLFWLVAGITVITIVYLLLLLNSGFFKKRRILKWLLSTFYFIAIFFVAIFIRLFVFEVFAVPTGSMENTLLPGDVILVNKLNYGPRLPRSPIDIPWVNLLFYKKAGYYEQNQWNYKRLPGNTKIKNGDVVVFNLPKNRHEYLVKRCIALPNDVLFINDGEISITGNKFNDAQNVKHQYRLYWNNHNDINIILNELDIKRTGYFNVRLQQNQKINLSEKQFYQLNQAGCIDSSIRVSIPKDTTVQVFPWHSEINWSIDNYGPLQIPAKGKTIRLSERNWILYRSILERYEKLVWDKNKSVFFKNGETVKSHTFTHNYYFMMGDNRHNSADSRIWGFVPDECIVGKVVFVLFSTNKEEKRLERVFRKLR